MKWFLRRIFLKRKKKCCCPTFTMTFQQRRKSPFFSAQQLITYSKRELAAAFHLWEDHFYQVWYKWMLIHVCSLTACFLGGDGLCIFKKDYPQKWVSQTNNYLWERFTLIKTTRGSERDSGGPKRGRNQGDDPFTRASAWKIPPVHPARAFCPKCSFAWMFKIMLPRAVACSFRGE